MNLLAITNFNVVTGVLGSWITLFGLFSYLFKERYHLSEACISLFAGVAFTHGAKLLKPLEYAGSRDNLDSVTLDFSRLVLGIQLVLVGVQLPSRYLQKEWKSLAILLGPGMVGMWACSSLLIWLLVPKLPVLSALVIGACITPTDPVLSNIIVKGTFADESVPKEVQNIIIAESGANDGLGYPFLFFALYIIQDKGLNTSEGVSRAIGRFLGQTCGYVVLLSIAYGWTIGWVAKELLQWAEKKTFVGRESFFVFAIALALLIIGTCGMAGSDDVLACFIAGNAFTWDDWFRLKTLDDSLQPTVDMLLNMAMFLWIGATCPWEKFWAADVIPLHRLIVLGILVLLLRRLPTILVLRRHIHQIMDLRQAFFVGYFGPIGVSAIFYLHVGLEFLKTVASDDQQASVGQLKEAMTVVIWYLTAFSVVVHGLSVPLGKLASPWREALSRPISLPV